MNDNAKRCGACNRPFSDTRKLSPYFLGVEDWENPIDPDAVVDRVICAECAEDRGLDQIAADINNDLSRQ